MFTSGFQSFAFQTVGTGVASSTNGGSPEPYIYNPDYNRRKYEILRQKTELQKIESVILEYQKQQDIAKQSAERARSEKRQQELIAKQNELLTEINRLLMVKAEMMARINREEESLILMSAISRRRLRAFNLTTIRI